MVEPRFNFTDDFGDARLEELRLLSWTERHGELSLDSAPEGPWHDLLLSLIARDLLTVFSYKTGQKTSFHPSTVKAQILLVHQECRTKASSNER